MDIRKQIVEVIRILTQEMGVSDVEIFVSHPELTRGDYTTNIAMILASKLGQNPRELASTLAGKLASQLEDMTEKVEAVGPGFINIWLKDDVLTSVLRPDENPGSNQLEGKKYLVEYAHPNTHKEMHIGHMRTLITGEAVSRLIETNGGQVFRANYQGDIGPHVAKAMYGIKKMMREKNITLEDIKKWDNAKRAHFLGEGYVIGNQDYEEANEEIDGINTMLYQHLARTNETKSTEETEDDSLWALYQQTRQWSLDYYEDFYTRFYTRFDRLFFESEMVVPGKRIVEENLGVVFVKDNGAIIFPGEKYGLHTRVFITKAGNPTYEGKEMGNGFAEEKAFPFELKIHVVASEQAGYFQVVFKALELIAPEKFQGKQLHISMGMVNLIGRKMSSRTGEILRVDELIDQVKEKVEYLAKEGKITSSTSPKPSPQSPKATAPSPQMGEGTIEEDIIEMVAIGAIKYSILKVGTGQNVAFDIEKSVSLEGDSGPYLQYTYARTQSVLSKSHMAHGLSKENDKRLAISDKLEEEESLLLRMLYRFGDITEEAGRQYSPNILCDYLFDLAKLYNLFYQKHKIIGSEHEGYRLSLTHTTGRVLKHGLSLLGIKAPQRM